MQLFHLYNVYSPKDIEAQINKVIEHKIKYKFYILHPSGDYYELSRIQLREIKKAHTKNHGVKIIIRESTMGGNSFFSYNPDGSPEISVENVGYDDLLGKEFMDSLPTSSQNTVATPAQMGRSGAQKSNERHVFAKDVAQKLARYIWVECPNLTTHEVTGKILLHFENVSSIRTLIQSKKIDYVDLPSAMQSILNKVKGEQVAYKNSTINNWIKEVMPQERKKGGRKRNSDET